MSEQQVRSKRSHKKAIIVCSLVFVIIAAVSFVTVHNTSRILFIDRNGNSVSPPTMEFSPAYVATLERLADENGVPRDTLRRSLGKIDEDGRAHTSANKVMLERQSFSEGLNALHFKDRAYFVDKEGQVAFTVQGAVFAEPFSDGLAAIATERGHDDRVVFPPGQHGFTPTGWGYVDKTGAFAIRPQFDSADGFAEGLASVEKDHKGGFIDKTGAYVIPPDFSRTLSFSEGLAPAAKDGKFGFIGHDGKWRIEPVFDSARPFSEGLAAVEQLREQDAIMMGKFGYIDKTGKLVIPFQYAQAEPFSEGLAAVAVGDDFSSRSWGYIDKTGAFQIQPQYMFGNSFANGSALVWRKTLFSSLWMRLHLLFHSPS